MSWDARQRAMLEAMGYHVHARAEVPAAVEEAPLPARPLSQAPSQPTRRPPDPANPADYGGLDLPGLREATARCQACRLCEERRTPVFGSGSEAPQWLVLIEPPDEGADASGEPLPGAAGKLLDNMLAAAGLSRAEVFITPVVKCRPPRGRAAQPDEMSACSGILARQIELLRPRLLLAMGRQPAQALTGSSEPIGKLRGEVHTSHDLPLIATYDAGYLLRAPADKAGAWTDLRLALQQKGPPASTP